jgi:hypothetical protein
MFKLTMVNSIRANSTAGKKGSNALDKPGRAKPMKTQLANS